MYCQQQLLQRGMFLASISLGPIKLLIQLSLANIHKTFIEESTGIEVFCLLQNTITTFGKKNIYISTAKQANLKIQT